MSAAGAVASVVVGSDTDRQGVNPDAAALPGALLPERRWDPATALESLTVIDDGTSLASITYDRNLFGQRWLDVDRNGCDTRIICIRKASQG